MATLFITIFVDNGGSTVHDDTYVFCCCACRRIDGIHHHKILNHEGIWRFEKAVSGNVCCVFLM